VGRLKNKNKVTGGRQRGRQPILLSEKQNSGVFLFCTHTVSTPDVLSLVPFFLPFFPQFWEFTRKQWLLLLSVISSASAKYKMSQTTKRKKKLLLVTGDEKPN
jgi:hypothetical protein